MRFLTHYSQFLGVGKIFRLHIESCRFFSPDLFMTISNFSKTVHTIFIKFCTVILHPEGPTCSKASKPYDWNVRDCQNWPKKSPKTVIFVLLPISQKLSVRFERNFLQSFHTILWSFMCSFIQFVRLGCEKHTQKYPKNGQKNSRFSTFFDFLKNCPYDWNELF